MSRDLLHFTHARLSGRLPIEPRASQLHELTHVVLAVRVYSPMNPIASASG